MKRAILSFNLLLVLALSLWSAAEAASLAVVGASPVYSPLAPPGCSKPKFGPAANYPAGTNPYSVAVGDFNGDGDSDLVAANRDSDDISVLLGNGAGGFGTATNLATGNQPRAVAVGDFNEDDNPDIALANLSSTSATVLLGDGIGSFGPPTSYGATAALASVLGDFNSDTYLDMAVGAGGDIAVYPGDGSGGFGAVITSTVGMIPWGMAAGDLNSDGKLDLVTASINFDAVSVLLGDGSGSFGPPTNITVEDPTSVALGYFNNDGNLDLAVADYFIAGTIGKVAVLMGNGSGGFGAPTYLSRSGAAHSFSVAVGDFNFDGKADLVTANEGGNNVSVLKGKGNGQFEAAVNFGTGVAPVSVAVGDFNGDGKPDLATANRFYAGSGSNNLSVLLNTCG